MSPVFGRIVLIAYVLGAMLIPWTHHHHTRTDASNSSAAVSEANCGCSSESRSSQSRTCRTTTLDRSATNQTLVATVSEGNESDSCGEACKICALLESGHSDGIPARSHELEHAACRGLGYFCCDLPNQEPHFLTAPRGPPAI